MKKEEIYKKLIEVGRKLVKEKGCDFLTARKLSEASTCSVGTIYNQFSNMDNFILAQNLITLDELAVKMKRELHGKNAYRSLNNCLDCFVDYVLKNQNLWFLLYNFHLQAKLGKLPKAYLRKLVGLTVLWQAQFDEVFTRLSVKEKALARQVLWLALFSLSSFLTTDSLDGFGKISKRNVCKLLLNTYLAGLKCI